MRKLTNNEAGAGVSSVHPAWVIPWPMNPPSNMSLAGLNILMTSMSPPILLHVATGQSTIAHGRIKSLNLDAVRVRRRCGRCHYC